MIVPDWRPAAEAAMFRVSGMLVACGDSLLSLAHLRRGWNGHVDAPPSPLLASLVPAVVLFYVVCLKYSTRGPTPGFKRLRSKPPGAGKEGSNWAKEGGVNGTGVEVTWLGARELRVLEAFGDTLLPGFDVGNKEGVDEAIEQVQQYPRCSPPRRGTVCSHAGSALGVPSERTAAVP